MKKHTITLYVNDPMGKRWMSNMDAARGAEKEFGAEIVVVKKTSKEYSQMKDPLPCPSVVVNGRIIARNDTVAEQALKTAILSDSGICIWRRVLCRKPLPCICLHRPIPTRTR